MYYCVYSACELMFKNLCLLTGDYGHQMTPSSAHFEAL